MRKILKTLKNMAKIAIIIHVSIFLAFSIVSLIYSFHNPKTTSLMIFRKLNDSHKVQDISFIPIKKIYPHTREMLITTEDPGFYFHHGIDVGAIMNAYRINKKLGYPKWGGSTITQQIARTLFLIPAKSYIRKYMEVLIALTMDLIIPKDRILELYINYIEFGKGIFGIGQASIYYYGDTFSNLHDEEIIRLITILPNPIKYDVSNFFSNKHLRKRYINLMNY
ncbi:transglycosylase domain-containing protein [Spirochaetota bacterium]